VRVVRSEKEIKKMEGTSNAERGMKGTGGGKGQKRRKGGGTSMPAKTLLLLKISQLSK
jgi:hypothetical protein